MYNNELHTKVLSAKQFLNGELVRLKTNGVSSPLQYREINDRLDLIHEVERVGFKNLGDREMRKLNKMLSTLNGVIVSSN